MKQTPTSTSVGDGIHEGLAHAHRDKVGDFFGSSPKTTTGARPGVVVEEPEPAPKPEHTCPGPECGKPVSKFKKARSDGQKDWDTGLIFCTTRCAYRYAVEKYGSGE